jgi:ubiquitin carboxyl-terminal hydrolase 4/11/15
MNSNTSGHESTQVSVDAALLGPLNPQAKNPPSRSQSPAKRLKSEEPPSTTVEHSLDVPDPMDEDIQPSTVERYASIDMLDATPETAGPVSSAEFSAVLPNTEAARPATNLSSTPPSPEEQVQMVVHAKNSTMSEGHEWYLISMTWLKRFMAQVPGYITNISKDELEKDIGPIDNSSLVDIAERDDLARKKSSDRMHILIRTPTR